MALFGGRAVNLRNLQSMMPQIDSKPRQRILLLIHWALHGPSTLLARDDEPTWITDPRARLKRERVDWAMTQIDKLLLNFGVESIQPEGAWVDAYYGSTVLLYANAGDPYETTIAYDTTNARFLLTCWGDFLEAWERRNVPARKD